MYRHSKYYVTILKEIIKSFWGNHKANKIIREHIIDIIYANINMILVHITLYNSK